MDGQGCFNCKWYVPGASFYRDYCLDRGGELDPEFWCGKWLDYKQRIDAMTGEYMEPLLTPEQVLARKVAELDIQEEN
jgi:hypothetical protein